MLFADLEHRFNADWKIKVAALRLSETNTSTHQRMHGNVAADGSGLTYASWVTDFDSTKLGLDAYVNASFDWLGLRNEVTLGANYSKYTSNDMYARTFTPGGNIFTINHNGPWQDEATIMAAGGQQTRATYDVQQKGLYASWRAKPSEPLTAIAGVRSSWYDYIYDESLYNTQTVNTASGEITPYLGLVYALTPQWSAYGSYTRVFEPQSARNAAGQVLDPIIGSNYELGLKGEPFDGRLNSSLAVFRYDHRNRAVNDVASGMACSGWYCSTPSGKVPQPGAGGRGQRRTGAQSAGDGRVYLQHHQIPQRPHQPGQGVQHLDAAQSGPRLGVLPPARRMECADRGRRRQRPEPYPGL